MIERPKPPNGEGLLGSDPMIILLYKLGVPLEVYDHGSRFRKAGWEDRALPKVTPAETLYYRRKHG